MRKLPALLLRDEADVLQEYAGEQGRELRGELGGADFAGGEAAGRGRPGSGDEGAFYDDITGEPLPADRVRAALAEEVSFIDGGGSVGSR